MDAASGCEVGAYVGGFAIKRLFAQASDEYHNFWDIWHGAAFPGGEMPPVGSRIYDAGRRCGVSILDGAAALGFRYRV